MRREIHSNVVGPNGSITETFGPQTIRTLVELGLIKKVDTSEVKYPEQNLVIQVDSYRKA